MKPNSKCVTFRKIQKNGQKPKFLVYYPLRKFKKMSKNQTVWCFSFFIFENFRFTLEKEINSRNRTRKFDEKKTRMYLSPMLMRTNKRMYHNWFCKRLMTFFFLTKTIRERGSQHFNRAEFCYDRHNPKKISLKNVLDPSRCSPIDCKQNSKIIFFGKKVDHLYFQHFVHWAWLLHTPIQL